jgi:hypothetical protein
LILVNGAEFLDDGERMIVSVRFVKAEDLNGSRQGEE